MRAVSEVHAVHSRAIGWGPQTDDHQLVVLLDQLHYDKQDRPFMHSRSYFIEGCSPSPSCAAHERRTASGDSGA